MASYNVHEAKTNLSKLLRRAERGEEIVIMRDGRPAAMLVQFRPARRGKVRLGWAKGEARAAAGWERSWNGAEVEAMFGGRL